MWYPGRIIQQGETDAEIVKALKRRLNELMGMDSNSEMRLDPDNPNFGIKMKRVVKLFQARNVDSEGRPLKQDGQIGSITWAALFGTENVPISTVSTDAFMSNVLRIAAQEESKRVREIPKNSNSGPEVDQYLKSTGLGPGYAWCCAFIFWCSEQAAKQMNCANRLYKTAGCLNHWNRAPSRGARRITKQHAIANPGLVKAGMIFIMDYGHGLGHTGLVETVTGGLITTVEGNTDASKTREGGGVYRLTRKIAEINRGFIDYTQA